MEISKEEKLAIRKIVRWLDRAQQGRFHGCLPSSYLCLDTETTGFKKEDDLIVSVGFCMVEDQHATEYESEILDWTNHPMVDRSWLQRKLVLCQESMERNGVSFHGVDYKTMRKYGAPPETVFENVLTKLEQTRDANCMYVGHNLVGFDAPRIEFALKEWLGAEFLFADDEILDTAAIVKASQTDLLPRKTELPTEFFRRVSNTPRKGILSNLSGFCVDHYGLEQDYVLHEEKAHSAGYDAMLCHLLLEKLRIIAGC